MRVAHDVQRPQAGAAEIAITWVGHSTFLIQAGGLNILTDPVWSERCSPVQWAGPSRHVPPGVAFDELPPIHLVLQSHDHYDHLDDLSVRAIAKRHPAARWVTSLGVGQHLRARGVGRIAELDWWEQHDDDALNVTCVPAQHFSGRSPFDRNRTLWAGFVLRVAGRCIYFVGDTGWHDDFAMIGQRCGPFDIVFMPVGAYEPRWLMQPVHVNPEEAVRAYGALRGAHPASNPALIAMHWGTFALTDEPIDEPPVRLRAAWQEAGHPAGQLWVMAPGQTRLHEPPSAPNSA